MATKKEEKTLTKILKIVRELNFDEFRGGDISLGENLESVLKELEYYKSRHEKSKLKIEQIIEAVSNFSAGDFSQSLPISEEEDELDVICMGLNTFREELVSTTISRDYFNNIYNAVSEMVFILDTKFAITDVNKALLEHFYFNRKAILGNAISRYLHGDLMKYIISETKKNIFIPETIQEANLLTEDGKSIPLECSLTALVDSDNIHIGYLILAKDISSRVKEDQLVFNTMVQTQEEERKRLAYDLHDSLGQELNAIKMQLSAVEFIGKKDTEKSMELLRNTMGLMDEAVKNVRAISYNLMPTALERGTLKDAIIELTSNIEKANNINFLTIVSDESYGFEKAFKISIYRVVQEFINSSLKHADPLNIEINISYTKDDEISIYLADDGNGFDIEKAELGKGLRSMRSRIKALNGEYHFESELNKGTSLTISFKNK